MRHEPVAFTYEADTHCPSCTEQRFGRGPRGFIAGDATDSEGNPVGVIAPWDEWFDAGCGAQTLACGTCGAVIAEYDDEPQDPEEEDITAPDPAGPFFYLGRRIAETRADLRAWMNAQRYFPNVWFISDHGNAHFLDVWEGAK